MRKGYSQQVARRRADQSAGRGGGLAGGGGALTELAGGGAVTAMYLNPLACVPLCLSGFVTTMFTVPPACDGVVATIDVRLATSTVVAAGTPPNETMAPGTKFVPVIVTVVPPFADPVLGTTPVTVGAAARVGASGGGAAA
jgi:hypothetical protein